MDQEIVKSVVSSSVLGKAYDDLIHPSAETLGKVINLVPRTISVWLRGWEKWVVNGEESVKRTIEAVGKRADNIPEEHLAEPPAHIAVPAIQQLAYCYDSAELREMYAKLLLSTMDDRTAEYVHPSFVQLLKELSPDEAKLLGTLVPTETANRPTIPIIDLRVVSDAANLGTVGLAHSFYWRVVIEGYNECCEGVCEHPEQSLVYLGNLERLGILEHCEHYAEKDKEKLLSFETSDAITRAKETSELKDGEKFEVRRWCYQVTDFGLNFIKVCVSQV